MGTPAHQNRTYKWKKKALIQIWKERGPLHTLKIGSSAQVENNGFRWIQFKMNKYVYDDSKYSSI